MRQVLVLLGMEMGGGWERGHERDPRGCPRASEGCVLIWG